jgi:hypothetical protein
MSSNLAMCGSQNWRAAVRARTAVLSIDRTAGFPDREWAVEAGDFGGCDAGEWRPAGGFAQK